MALKDIQPALLAHFQQLVKSHKLSHAYLFSGGFGSMEMAVYLAQAIFCQDSADGLPCGNCRSCRLIVSHDFVDLHLVEPMGQSIRIEQIRDLLQSFATSGFESNKKVVIIREAQRMTPSAANALLKSIEEPESDVTIFLLVDNELQVLDTIRSRTQIISFPHNSRYLQELLEKQGLLKSDAVLISLLTSSEEEASALAASDWFLEASKKLTKWQALSQDSPDDAFLYLPQLIENFPEKSQQEKAFEQLLIGYGQAQDTRLTLKTFEAEKMWGHNVRFQACLEYILL